MNPDDNTSRDTQLRRILSLGLIVPQSPVALSTALQPSRRSPDVFGTAGLDKYERSWDLGL